MRFVVARRFRRAYRKLSPEDRKRVGLALRRIAEDPRHPGLHVKRMQGTRGIWEARASRSLRITFEMKGDDLVLRKVGHHDEALDASIGT